MLEVSPLDHRFCFLLEQWVLPTVEAAVAAAAEVQYLVTHQFLSYHQTTLVKMKYGSWSV